MNESSYPPPNPRPPDLSSPDADSGMQGAVRAWDRRDFLKLTGVALGTTLPLPGHVPFAGPFEGGGGTDHRVPVDKKLRPEWVRGLFARGERTWYGGDHLDTIGMPVGGICAGQVYLGGDGRLLYWDIFNQQHNSGYGAMNYKVGRRANVAANPNALFEMPALAQGVAVRVRQAGKTVVRHLSRAGFPEVRFCGEYPIGHVEYPDKALPVEVRLEAFSPFIPLNEEDSALPVTVLNYTVRNRSAEEAEVTLAAWLQNAVCRHSQERFAGRLRRENRVLARAGLTAVQGRVLAVEPLPGEAVRPPILFADFEGSDYGAWRVEGEAFGAKPAAGTLEGQQKVSGFAGKGLVNTFLGGDKPHGKLISPEFTVARKWITFLVGGGGQKNQTCMNLVVGGKVVRTLTGKNNERLEAANWNVEEFAGAQAHLEIVDSASGAWGHINIDHIEFRDEPRSDEPADLADQADYGTMAVAVLGSDGVFASPEVGEGELRELSPSVFAGGSEGLAEATGGRLGQPLIGRVGRTVALKPGGEVTLTFLVAWHLPNLYREKRMVRNYYGKRFRDALAVIDHVAANRDRLFRETRLWRDTYYDSTLPYWLLDRLHSTVSNLATTTCQWWANGRFWAWEGCGCCHGTCGHVWNYEHAMARLFPRLERSVREMQDFAPGVGLHENGAIGFRGEGWGLWAGDAQGGYILKAYREHQVSKDDAFLKRNWGHIKRAVEFLLHEDGNADGLIEGSQHQTYDQNYFGANTFVGSLYLGALRAAEEMAREVGDAGFAAKCRAVFESGAKLSSRRLFNGEYFIQEVDLKKHPEWQYADGCLADQMFGQGWAHQVGLGYLYPVSEVHAALQSVWKYCWAPDVGPQNKAHGPQRWFAYPGEAGLFTCTWPKSKHLGPKSTVYRDEIWTGIEYQVAGHMVWEGMLTEAFAICRGIHDRYHPAKHNPWNEIECGDHYARALASWGVLTALCGFEYHGPARRIAFAPRLQADNFKAVFTTADGWGTLSQSRVGTTQTNRFAVRWGQVALTQVALQLPASTRARHVKLAVAGKEVPCQWKAEGERVTVSFDQGAIEAGREAVLTTEWAA
ncbi:MAG: hypothetical protein JXQ71_09055 [Verrucomicrobia bacterium]|nr:hypothetical protein [Verrucomicrobiota bacterium]